MTPMQIWQAITETEARQHDKTLPIEVRVRSMQTYAQLLRAAAAHGHTYMSLRDLAHTIA